MRWGSVGTSLANVAISKRRIGHHLVYVRLVGFVVFAQSLSKLERRDSQHAQAQSLRCTNFLVIFGYNFCIDFIIT
jgi:hypothetical protein